MKPTKNNSLITIVCNGNFSQIKKSFLKLTGSSKQRHQSLPDLLDLSDRRFASNDSCLQNEAVGQTVVETPMLSVVPVETRNEDAFRL